MCTGKGSNVCPPRKDALSGTDLKSMRTLPRRKGVYCTICAFSLCPNMWLQFRAAMLKSGTGREEILSSLSSCVCVSVKNNRLFRDGCSLAGAEGLEPSRTVLETAMLPLHHAPVCAFQTALLLYQTGRKKASPFPPDPAKKYITRTGSDTGAGSNRRFFPSPPVKILPAAAARTAAGSLSCLPVPGDRCPCRQNRSRSSSSLCLPR